MIYQGLLGFTCNTHVADWLRLLLSGTRDDVLEEIMCHDVAKEGDDLEIV